jgi:seryl-tRNA synthetase
MPKTIVFEPQFKLDKNERYSTEREAVKHNKIKVYGLYALSPENTDKYLDKIIKPKLKEEKIRKAERGIRKEEKHIAELMTKQEDEQKAHEAAKEVSSTVLQHLKKVKREIKDSRKAIEKQIRKLKRIRDPDSQIPALLLELSNLDEQAKQVETYKEELPTLVKVEAPKPSPPPSTAKLNKWTDVIAQHKGERNNGERWGLFLRRLSELYYR